MKYFQILLLLGIIFSTLLLGQSIEIPHKMMKQETALNIPIFIYNVSNLESIQLKIEYDETIVKALGIIENPVGILDGGYTFTTNISEPGIIYLVIFSSSTNVFSGSGMIAQITFKSIGNLGEFSSLIFLDAQINSDWEVPVVDGSIEIILDELTFTAVDQPGAGSDDFIRFGMCETCTNGWRYGEDEYDNPNSQSVYTDIYFFNLDWHGQTDVNDNTCDQVKFASDYRQQHSSTQLLSWGISGSTDGLSSDTPIILSWDSSKLSSISDNFKMFIYVGNKDGVDMQGQNSITILQSDLSLNGNAEPNIWVKMGGCADTGATITYYQDFDGDGLGSSVEREFCEGLHPGWVETNDGDTCDGNEDCLGACGGHAIRDECDVCDLDNNNNNQCFDCNGVANGEALLDNCSSCIGGDTGEVACQLDCLGVWGGNATDSECGICSSPNSVDECGVCDTDFTNDCVQDCNDDWGGFATIDDCGICDSDSSNNNQCYDCNNLANGLDGIPNNGDEAYFDNCGECDNDSENDCQLDCTEKWGGDASFDNCQICVGGSTGLIPCEQDCNGDWGGYAFMDECDVCDSNNTNNNQCSDCNFEPNGGAIIDNCNECILEGEDTTCEMDCKGEWGGDAVLDECGVCNYYDIQPVFPYGTCDCAGTPNGEGWLNACEECVPLGDTSCAEDCNGVIDGLAYLDNCNECILEGEDTTCEMDCNGDWGGSAIIDRNCEICIEGMTGFEACSLDCNGVWGGNYEIDLCGICDADSENNNQCVDCNGTVDGLAELDNCGNCVEDSSDFSYECELDCDGIWGGNHPPSFFCQNGDLACNFDACFNLANNEFQLPQKFDINRIYPNPFNPQTTIDFEVSKPTMVQLNIYNLNGQKVDVLKNAFTLSGNYSVSWNGTNHPSGIYFVILHSSNSVVKQKMMLIK